MRFVLIAVILLTGASNANETFECQSGRSWDNEGKTLVTASIFGETGGATIEVAGIVHLAVYRVTGFNRRWDFGEASNQRYEYAFIIKPDGDATYYDFSNSDVARDKFPTQFFFCKQTN